MNEALSEAVYERFRFIEWDIILASIHSLFKGSIQPSNASYCSPKLIRGLVDILAPVLVSFSESSLFVFNILSTHHLHSQWQDSPLLWSGPSHHAILVEPFRRKRPVESVINERFVQYFPSGGMT